MRYFLAILITLILCGDVYANIQTMQQMVIARKNSSGVDNANITFYHDADALDNANCSDGSGTVTYDGGILLGTSSPAVGTGYWDNNNDGFDDLSFAISGNVDFSGGRIGFWHKPNEGGTNAGRVVWTDGGDFVLQASSSLDGTFSITYLGNTDTSFGSFSTGTWQYIEVEFNGSSVETFINDVSVDSRSGTGSVNDTTFHFASINGAAWDSHYDNIVISTDPNEDLYSRRNDTDFCA